jgi:hypothetical protein
VYSELLLLMSKYAIRLQLLLLLLLLLSLNEESLLLSHELKPLRLLMLRRPRSRVGRPRALRLLLYIVTRT